MKWEIFRQLILKLEQRETVEDRKKLVQFVEENWEYMDWFHLEVLLDKIDITYKIVAEQLPFAKELVNKAEEFKSKFTNVRTRLRLEYLKMIINELDQRDSENQE